MALGWVKWITSAVRRGLSATATWVRMRAAGVVVGREEFRALWRHEFAAEEKRGAAFRLRGMEYPGYESMSLSAYNIRAPFVMSFQVNIYDPAIGAFRMEYRSLSFSALRRKQDIEAYARGVFSQYFAQYGLQVTAVDLSHGYYATEAALRRKR
jgi:hypothetical protein